MSLSDWHLRDGQKPTVKRRAGNAGPARRHNTPKSYTPEDVDKFCQAIRDGHSVVGAVRLTGIPVSKAYDMLAVDNELRAHHERNKSMRKNKK